LPYDPRIEKNWYVSALKKVDRYRKMVKKTLLTKEEKKKYLPPKKKK